MKATTTTRNLDISTEAIEALVTARKAVLSNLKEDVCEAIQSIWDDRPHDARVILEGVMSDLFRLDE